MAKQATAAVPTRCASPLLSACKQSMAVLAVHARPAVATGRARAWGSVDNIRLKGLDETFKRAS